MNVTKRKEKEGRKKKERRKERKRKEKRKKEKKKKEFFHHGGNDANDSVPLKGNKRDPLLSYNSGKT